MDPSEEAFKILPIINPINGEDIKVGSKEYKKLIKLYGEPNKIKSPVSDKMISVGKGEYKNLIKQGYNEKELFVPTKTYIVGNKKYTEQELLMMIEFFNTSNSSKTMSKETYTVIPDDVLNHIFLQLDVDALYKMCSLNNKYNKLCVSKTFWMNKSANDGIPFFEITGSLKKWVQHYKKWKDAFTVSNKLVNYMLDKKTNYFNGFSIDDGVMVFKRASFLPKEIVNIIKQTDITNSIDRTLEFNIKELKIIFNYLAENSNNDFQEVVVSVTKEQLIMYLAKIFYYFPKVAITNDIEYEADEDDVAEFDSMYLPYCAFINDVSSIKKSLKEWK
jgi:hypothetical protein